MNKSELAHDLALRCNLTRRGAAACVDAVFDLIAEAVQTGEKVTLVGFGSFFRVEKAATTRNAFGKTVRVPAKRVVKFKAGNGLQVVVE